MKKPLAAQQARSRDSLERLLRAAAEILQEDGLEGATIPRVVARAGLSPGAVYRRFPDKDALIQTVVLTIMEQNDAHVAGLLTRERAASSNLAEAVESVLRQTVASYRAHSRLLTAITQFFRSHPDEAFRRRVDEIETHTFRRVVAYFQQFRTEIRHPRPEEALAFAYSVAGHALREIVLMEVMTDVWKPLLPRDDKQLVRELTVMVLSYLRAAVDEASTS